MGLVASNTDQLLTVITSKRDLDGLDLAKIVLISFSLTVQVSKLETIFKSYPIKNFNVCRKNKDKFVLFPLQIVLMLILTWIAILKPIPPHDSEESFKRRKLETRYQRLNTAAAFLGCITTFLNVIITSFSGHALPGSQPSEIGIKHT